MTFLHSENETSAIGDDARASIFASWYNIHMAAFGAADRPAAKIYIYIFNKLGESYED